MRPEAIGPGAHGHCAAPERALLIPCAGESMVGVLHQGAPRAPVGIVLIVGGPQYRVGSHRQFLLLARHAAAQGIPVLRFDCRGMGDSSGLPRTFEDIDEDIRAAIDAFFGQAPDLKGVVLWGLCDAASAALMYGWRDKRVGGLVLVNPWVHTEIGEARARLRNYYWARLKSPAFWLKLARLEIDWRDTLGSLAGYLRRAVGRAGEGERRNGHAASNPPHPVPFDSAQDRPLPRGEREPSQEPPGRGGGSRPHYVERMLDGLNRFGGKIGVVLSGNDLTAEEYRGLIGSSKAWRRATAKKISAVHEIPQANHTFSRRDWRDEVARKTVEWVRAWSSQRD